MNPPPPSHVIHAPMRAGPAFDRVMQKIWDSRRVRKITFTGGEPLLEAEDLLLMLASCHALGFETTVTTNGTLLTRDWLVRASNYLSFVGFSIDTLDDELNRMHGRCISESTHLGDAPASQVAHALSMIDECAQLHLPYKINTVVTSLSCQDITLVSALPSFPGNLLRWKIIRCTAPPTARRAANYFRPTDVQWQAYMTRVSDYATMCDLSNKIFFEDRADTMQSYLLMTSDWKLEILGEEHLRYTRSLVDGAVDVAAVITETGFDLVQAAKFRNVTTRDDKIATDIEDAWSLSPCNATL